MTSIVLWSHHQSVLMSRSLFVCQMKSVSAFCFPPLSFFVAAAAPRLLLLLDEAEHFLALPSVDSLAWKQTWRRCPPSSTDILLCVLQPEEVVLCDRSCWCHLIDFRTFSSETSSSAVSSLVNLQICLLHILSGRIFSFVRQQQNFIKLVSVGHLLQINIIIYYYIIIFIYL